MNEEEYSKKPAWFLGKSSWKSGFLDHHQIRSELPVHD